MARKRPTTMKLPGLLDGRAAIGLRAALLERRGKPLALDASEVVTLGALSAQVLVSAARTWRADGVELQLKAVSEALSNGLRLLGLGTHDITTGA